MTEYIDEHLNVAETLLEDDYLSQYKRKLIFRKNIGLVLLGIYALLFFMQVLVNLLSFISSKNIEDLNTVNPVGVLAFAFSFLFLFYGVKVRGGASFYELPVISQTLGRRLAPQSILDYFSGLEGEDASIVKNTISSFVRLNIMKSDRVTNKHIRHLEDSIVSERARQAKL
jgi:hypothetical protein